MESLLKALGLAVWSLIGIGLLAVFMFIGYQAALRIHRPGAEALATEAASASPPPPPSPATRGDADASAPGGADHTRTLLYDAAAAHDLGAAIAYARSLTDSGNAVPEDYLALVNGYYAIKDCPGTLKWAARAGKAYQLAHQEPDASLDQVRSRCRSDRNANYLAPDGPQRDRMLRFLESVKVRADADRANLPTLEAQAAHSASGEADVALGKIYFGYGEYQHAVAAITRGLGKGQVKHLEDAYVYLGLSHQALDQVSEARKAFESLKSVSDINPRVLALWLLYADTRL